MDNQIAKLKKMIENVEVVSFDVFDTLIKRCLNSPETVFELVGRQFDISNFGDLRQKYQSLASQKAEREQKIPHADIDQIYEYIKDHEESNIAWNQVKEKELEIEGSCSYCNKEMYDVFEYAKSCNKRVVITSDMYLKKSHIEYILEKCGYTGYDKIYVSSEVHATKYIGDIYEIICRNEGKNGQKILHIGDNLVSDYDNAKKNGLNAFHYKALQIGEDKKGICPSLIEYGIVQKLITPQKDFWYNLGAVVGGPLYLGLYQWIQQRIKCIEVKKIFLLARDGYNLYQILKDNADYNVEYLYMSRRSLLLAGIDKLDDEALTILPPFTWGQTVREILSYLGVEKECGHHMETAGLSGLDDVIKDAEDIQKVKKLYLLNSNAFLKKCAEERKYAIQYFQRIGFLKQDNIVFDCGWNGSSQYLLERFLKHVDYKYSNYFLYVGILDSEKSRRQLKNRVYDSYLFDYSHSQLMQDKLRGSIVLCELFFGAPEPSVYCYNEQGVAFEKTNIVESYKSQLCEGIKDYIYEAEKIVEKYHIEISKDNAVSALIRLINTPTLEEAKIIGDLKNVDGFVKKKGIEKYIAKLDMETYIQNPNIEIYWIQGLLKRDDIDQNLKEKIVRDKGLSLEVEDYQFKKRVKKSFWGYWNKRYLIPVQDEYELWREKNEKTIVKKIKLEYSPLISVVVPVYNVTDDQLIACIESVKAQCYENWELIMVDDASTWENVRITLRQYEKDDRIRIYYRKENGHISKATNDGIEKAEGEFIAFMDCDDTISNDALYEMAKMLNKNPELDFIYSDEDKLSEDGKRRHSPFFKPDWSPDTFMSLMYTNHFAMYRKDIVKKVGGLRTEFNGAQDYDFTLRFMECSDNKKIGHIPKVLYHWRERKESVAKDMGAKPYVLEAVKKAKEEALLRRGQNGYVEYVNDMCQYRVVYENDLKELVSIIILSKDNVKLLFQCVDSIIKHTSYPNYEIIIIDNGSNKRNLEKIEDYIFGKNIVYHYRKMEFNFSEMCNIGAKIAKGKYLLFLNDDIEVFDSSWLGRLAGQASLTHIGAVGVKLLYPDSNIIQHDGIGNLEIGPAHLIMGFRDNGVYYFGRNRMDYNYLAVTAACLMIEKKKFFQVGGFETGLAVAYNDIDLCFKLYEAGYYNIVRNDVVMYHYESASRGNDDVDEQKKERLLKERKLLYERHPKLEGRDPFYNENLSQKKVDFSLNVEKAMSHAAIKMGRFCLKNKYHSSFHAVIDNIDYADMLNIRGWFFWKRDYISNAAVMYLVLRDKYNHCFYFKVQRKIREDVAEALGNEAYYTGFECMIPYAMLRLNELQYQIGIMVQIPKTKITRICWTQMWTSQITEDIYKSRMSEYEIKADEIDKMEIYTEYRFELIEKGYIRGWALDRNSMDNDYQDFQLLYRRNDKWFCKEVVRKMRFDIAKIFADIPNCLWCGFEGWDVREDVKDIKIVRWKRIGA